MKDRYFAVTKSAEVTTVIERSKFIGFAAYVDGEEAAKEFVGSIKKKHPLATHNCYGFIADSLGNIQKFSDDGEPQGTAGLPILEVIKNQNLVKTAVVITRYFGGVKLGGGGLVRAYSASTANTLLQSGIKEFVKSVMLDIELGYDFLQPLQYFLSGNNIEIKNIEYTESIKLSAAIEESSKELIVKQLLDYMQGKVTVKIRQGAFYAITK